MSERKWGGSWGRLEEPLENNASLTPVKGGMAGEKHLRVLCNVLSKAEGWSSNQVATGGLCMVQNQAGQAHHWSHRSSLGEVWGSPRCGDGFRSAEARVSGQGNSPRLGVCEAHFPGYHRSLQF